MGRSESQTIPTGWAWALFIVAHISSELFFFTNVKIFIFVSLVHLFLYVEDTKGWGSVTKYKGKIEITNKSEFTIHIKDIGGTCGNLQLHFF
jgi:hypothetical protein